MSKLALSGPGFQLLDNESDEEIYTSSCANSVTKIFNPADENGPLSSLLSFDPDTIESKRKKSLSTISNVDRQLPPHSKHQDSATSEITSSKNGKLEKSSDGISACSIPEARIRSYMNR